MNTWQALKNIVRDQFSHPVQEPERGHIIVWHIVNTGARTIMSEEFPTEDAAQARIAAWKCDGENVMYLDTFMKGRRL